jgi:hypothetical protein
MSIMDSNDIFFPHMPEVFTPEDLAGVFDRARSAAADLTQDVDGVYHRQIIIVTPGRLLVKKECPLAAELQPAQIALLEKFVPRKPILKICAIAFTELEALKKDMRRAIPFIDYLLGFASLGHSVWVFEGHSSALAQGCREADLLLVDSGMLPELEKNPNWQATAEQAMRTPEIKLVSRSGR